MVDFNTATISDVIQNPEAYGAPTFDQFVKNRHHYTSKDELLAESVDQGSKWFRRNVSYRYYFLGYRCDSLEQVERIAKSEGYTWSDLELKPELEKDEVGKVLFHVHFVPKTALSEEHERQAIDGIKKTLE